MSQLVVQELHCFFAVALSSEMNALVLVVFVERAESLWQDLFEDESFELKKQAG